jgi:hypothetical protein
LDRGILLAIAGSILVFVIILAVVFYSHSDFDQQLIEQVDSGVPAGKLIPQINQETKKLTINAQKRYQSNVVNKMNENDEHGNLESKNDYKYYQDLYENEMKMISDYDAARKKFVRREITKEQFLQEIKIPKEYKQIVNSF